MSCASAHDVENDAAVDAVSVPRFLSEERRRIILGLHRDEAIVAAQTPAAGVPLHTPTDVRREKRGRVVDADLGAFEQAQAAETCGRVRHDRATSSVDDQVAAVVQKVRGLHVCRTGDEVETLRDAEQTADLAFDPDEPVEVHRGGAAKVVVAEARTIAVARFGEERRAARNDGDLERARTRCWLPCLSLRTIDANE